ncbi:lipopolysaccharide biosynthesis protein [Lachnoclostridium sp.]|uniref:lipopolysaccharide biosynthesis protein n=1 Tax=Lachnoclostridium sp. TaxID=2028282 RepID=UPI00289FDCD0|nr:oligosaccharide flippase family protein [Lachnoclostridium sp.]
MNENILHTGIKKIINAMITQIFILICSLVTGFILPKYMGTEMYGYWQIYYFYLSYLNFITLGFNDGISLRYGGVEENELPLKKIRSAIQILMQFILILMFIFIILLKIVNINIEMSYIYMVLILSIPCVCIMNIIVTIYLSINKQNIYNKINLGNKLASTLIYCILLLIGMKNFRIIIMSDYIVRIFMTIICIVIGRKFIFGSKDNYKKGLKEVQRNCSIGIFITFGALASSFIPMGGRIVIEHNESIQVYGIFSFAMSLLGIIVTFTNTAGMIFFPILKKISKEKLSAYYPKIKEAYNCILYISLYSYIPAVFIINHFLPDYKSVLSYAFILFAMCIPLGKIQTLVTTYYKAFRMEQQYFFANLFGIILMITGTFFVYNIFETVQSVAVITTILFTIWSYGLEIYLLKKLNYIINIHTFEELFVMLVFTFFASTQNILIFLTGYSFVIFVMFIIKRKKLVCICKEITN